MNNETNVQLSCNSILSAAAIVIFDIDVSVGIVRSQYIRSDPKAPVLLKVKCLHAPRHGTWSAAKGPVAAGFRFDDKPAVFVNPNCPASAVNGPT